MDNTNIILILALYLLIVSFISIIITVVDKRKAIKNKYRIPEKHLLFWGFIGGALPMFITMSVIRHKTKHKKFMILLPIFTIMQLTILIICMIYYT